MILILEEGQKTKDDISNKYDVKKKQQSSTYVQQLGEAGPKLSHTHSHTHTHTHTRKEFEHQQPFISGQLTCKMLRTYEILTTLDEAKKGVFASKGVVVS